MRFLKNSQNDHVRRDAALPTGKAPYEVDLVERSAYMTGDTPHLGSLTSVA